VATYPINRPWRLVLTESQKQFLWAHLFPGDHDEHAAALHCGIAISDRQVRLLVREVILAEEGRDFVQGTRSYKKLKGEFIARQIEEHEHLGTAYIAVHNHGGENEVAFSAVDLKSHERGYPALLDLIGGPPVGAVVCARNAVAGDIWLPSGDRVPLASTIVVGLNREVLTPAPVRPRFKVDPSFDRQSRLFGDAGQRILAGSRVAVIGVGGVGSLVVQQLGRLGVGEVIMIDHDRLELSNVSRVIGSKPSRLLRVLDRLKDESWLKRKLLKFAPRKVDIASHVATFPSFSRAVPRFGSVVQQSNAQLLTDCDFIFLAGDEHSARLVVNEIGHQYLIPFVQLGAKVPVDDSTGQVGEVFAVERPVWPDGGCLWCNGLINRRRLELEGKSEKQRKAQRYVNDPGVKAPSVISLNSVTAALGVNSFLLYMTGLHEVDAEIVALRYIARDRSFVRELPRKSAGCPFCGLGDESGFALGDSRELVSAQR
jgi:ThiF family